MQPRTTFPRIGLSELLLVLGVSIMLGTLIAPALPRASVMEKQKQCLTQVRQMATAAQMFNQDHNGCFPGVDWAKGLVAYLGDQSKMLCCPEDASDGMTAPVNYGYSSLLVRCDGSGVNEAQIKAPTEVGVVCDAAPAREFPNGGLIGGGALRDDLTVQPFSRHAQGIIIGYADGHARYWPKEPDAHDAANPITRAFYTAGPLRLIDNPAGGTGGVSVPAVVNTTSIMLGGDFNTSPLLLTAAEIWKQKTGVAYTTRGFRGQYYAANRSADYLWGCCGNTPPPGKAIPIARDAMVLIVAKNSKIPIPGIQTAENGACMLDYPLIHSLFDEGYRVNNFQCYSYNNDSGSARFFRSKFGEGEETLTIGATAIVCIDDEEMVDKVANDPYGIGYCSSAFADPWRVQVVDLKLDDDEIARFPRKELAHRWEYPTTTSWPLMRTLYVVCGGKSWQADGSGIANILLAPSSPGMKALQAGPLFGTGYFLP